MYPFHAFTAGWLSLLFWHHPEPDYWQIWMQRTMRSQVLPYISGV